MCWTWSNEVCTIIVILISEVRLLFILLEEKNNGYYCLEQQ